MSKKIILASQSPRRKQILEWAAMPFTVVIKNVDEVYPDSLLTTEVPEYLATIKAQAVAAETDLQQHIIVAADTIVIHKNTIYGKPKDRADAIATLKTLSNETHQVITGVCLLWDDKKYSFSETTQVTFSPLTDQEIDFYIDTYKPYDKAGAYAIQEWIGVTTIQKVNGCFFNVMGLPMNRLYHEMKRLQLIV